MPDLVQVAGTAVNLQRVRRIEYIYTPPNAVNVTGFYLYMDPHDTRVVRQGDPGFTQIMTFLNANGVTIT